MAHNCCACRPGPDAFSLPSLNSSSHCYHTLISVSPQTSPPTPSVLTVTAFHSVHASSAFCSMSSTASTLCLLFCILLPVSHAADPDPNPAPVPPLSSTPSASPSPYSVTADRIALSSITKLTLRSDLTIRSRFPDPPPQLRCVGGSASGLWFLHGYAPQKATCLRDPSPSTKWTCHANLAQFVFFAPQSRVICEPFTPGTDDGYVLRNSCRFDYILNFTYFRLSSVHITYG